MSVRDTTLLKKYIKFGVLLAAISPPLKNVTKGRRLLFNTYIVLLFLLFTITSIYNLRGRLYFVNKNITLTQGIMDFLEIFTEFGFITSVLFGAIVFKQPWKTLLEKVSIIDSKLKADVPKVGILYCSKGVIYIFAFCLYELYEILAWTSSKEMYYITYRIAIFYQLFTLFLIGELVNLLIRRYQYLIGLLKKSSAMGTNKVYMKANLREIRTHYILLNGICKEISVIFGRLMMFVLATSIVLISNLWNWLVNALAGDIGAIKEMRYIIVSDFLFFFFNIIVIIVPVLNCDKLEKTGQDIVKTCYILQEHTVIEQMEFRGELALLSNFFKELSPKISACGYFFVNKKLLSRLFLAMTSYIIVILQFRVNEISN